MEKISFAFFGTPELAVQTLDALFECGYIPSVIITSPDRPAGRGMHLTATPVSIWAENHDIPWILKPEKIDQEFIDDFKKFNIDLSIVVAYGKILPKMLIEIPRLGTINIHYSLLPKYRGASPVEQALLHGDITTGVSIQKMKFKLDSGPIIVEQETSISITETKEELRKRLTDIGSKMLCELLPNIDSKDIIPKEQDESFATYCSKIKKEDGHIDPNGNAIENYNKYRAFQRWPGVYFFIHKNDRNIRIHIKKAKYENDSFIIERVVPEGKKEISYQDFLRN